jgi:hypothetical protein
MRIARYRLLGAALSAAFVAAVAAGADRVERLEIVDRAIEYHGGSLFTSSTSELDMCSRSGCFGVVAKMDGGLFDLDITQESRGRRVRLTNDRAELWQDGNPVAVTDDDRARQQSFVFQRVYFAFLPFRLNDPGVYKEDRGLVDWQGRTLHEVLVSFEPHSSAGAESQYMYWFDPETGRLEQFAYDYEDGLRFQVATNHRRVGGVLFFDRENFGLNAEGLTVKAIDPSYVSEELRAISTIELRNLSVRPLESGR